MEWLASVGEVKADFRQLRLTITKGDSEQILTGDPTLSKSKTSFKRLLQEMKSESSYFLIKWQEEREVNKLSVVPVGLLRILESHAEIFQDLVGLPPRHI